MKALPPPSALSSSSPRQISQIGSPSLTATTSSGQDEELWDLNWLLSVLRRKAPLILLLAVSTTALAVGGLMLFNTVTKPKYAGTFQLQVEPATAEAKSSQSFVRAQTTERGLEALQGTNLEQNSTLDYETQIRILKSSKLLLPIVEQIQLRYPQITYELLTKQMTIERIKITKDGKEQGTKLLEISYTAGDPKEILFVLQQLSQAYLKYSLQERQTNIRQGMKFIDRQLPQLRERVNGLQIQIESLRQQSNSMDPAQQAVDFSQLLSAVKRQKVDINTKLAEVQARHQTLKQRLKVDNAVAVLSEFPSSQKLLDRYHELKTQIAISAARFREDSPQMESLQEEAAKLQNLLSQEAERILAQAAAQVEIVQNQQQEITKAEDNLNQQFQKLPELSRKYDSLKQDLKIAAETLDRYLSKREALGIDAAQQEIPWETIAPPTLKQDLKGKPINLSKPNLRLLVPLATILSILLAIAVAFLIEVLQDILYTPQEVQRLTNLPVLATIPLPGRSNSLSYSSTDAIAAAGQIKAESSFDPATPYDFTALTPQRSKTELFNESFNLLYSNLGVAKARSPVRAIAISSSQSQEGKSKVAIYLAKAAAATGKKVLLVDADLRSPQLQAYLKLHNDNGLSDLIQSQLDVRKVIQPSFVEDNLFLLGAGRSLSHPVRLLSSAKMRSLMQQFTANFDLVIYNTPPIEFSDLSWLGSQVDGVILAARLGKTKRAILKQAIEGLKISQISILGIVTT
jgi:capsular exopolysaccharide synthesis family protein